MQGLGRRPRTFIVFVAGMALAALAAAAVAVSRAPPALDPWLALGGLAFAGSIFALERAAVTFVWRGHKVSTSLTEAAIFLALYGLPAAVPVLLMPLGLVVIHLRSGRSPIKGLFNVAHGTVATAAGAAAALVLGALGAPLLLAAAVGTIVYSLVSDALLATLFAFLEDLPSPKVYVERLLMANVLAIFTGIPSGLVLVGLWNISPLALLAAVPLAVLVLRHAHLQASVDRELAVRRRLVDDARGLIGTAESEVIAHLVLKTCGDLLDASRARFTLADGTVVEDAFDQSPVPTRPPLSARVVGRDGKELGVISVWERPLKRRYGDDERALLAIVAGQAGHALESAQALVEIANQRDLIARQEKLSALGMLMAGVAHEINNPLTFMRLRLDVTRRETRKLLDREGVTPSERAYAESVLKSVETFERGLDRLATLCNGLKAVARPGDGQRHPTKLNDVAAEVVTVVRAAHKEIDFQLDLAPDLPMTHANPAELHQVLLNLVKNASEALQDRESPSIRVSTRAEGSSIRLEVQDNGPGIPPEAARKLFMPFFTTKKTGTGLGLSISHQIVTAHGGQMTFETAPGQGTTFRVVLPALAQVPEVAVQA